MNDNKQSSAGAVLCTAFEGRRRIATGELPAVARETKPVADAGGHLPILIFDDATSELIEVDFRGTTAQVIERLTQNRSLGSPVSDGLRRRSPGRPRLGVIAREVTLLPGQWEWLDAQAGGASSALRRLVHEAKKGGEGKDRARHSQEAVYKFMTVMAGDLPGYEEALRAFYRKDQARFAELIKPWPKDIRSQVKKLCGQSERAGANAGNGTGITGNVTSRLS